MSWMRYAESLIWSTTHKPCSLITLPIWLMASLFLDVTNLKLLRKMKMLSVIKFEVFWGIYYEYIDEMFYHYNWCCYEGFMSHTNTHMHVPVFTLQIICLAWHDLHFRFLSSVFTRNQLLVSGNATYSTPNLYVNCGVLFFIHINAEWLMLMSGLSPAWRCLWSTKVTA